MLYSDIKRHGVKIRKPNLLTSGAWRLMWNKFYISVDLLSTSPICLPLSLKGQWLWLQCCGFQTIWCSTAGNSSKSPHLTVLHCHGTGTTGTTEMCEIFMSGDIFLRENKTKQKPSLYPIEKIINREWLLQEEKKKSEKQKQLQCENIQNK